MFLQILQIFRFVDKKKTTGFRTGDLATQTIGPRLRINVPLKVVYSDGSSRVKNRLETDTSN